MQGEIDEFAPQVAGGGIGDPVGDRDVIRLQLLQGRESILQIVVGELLAARRQRLQRLVGDLRGRPHRLVEAADSVRECLARLRAIERGARCAAAHRAHHFRDALGVEATARQHLRGQFAHPLADRLLVGLRFISRLPCRSFGIGHLAPPVSKERSG
jgi:hypothetical protein